MDKHKPHGGVVPEIASRCHAEVIRDVVEKAVADAGIAWSDISAVAGTRGPGLASSLLVGWSAAKGLAVSLGCPLVAVNHIEAHVHSVFLDRESPSPEEAMPLVAMTVSGGHTSIFSMTGYGKYETLARTIDDAAGEALDKAAKLLGLGYPGGPVIDRISKGTELSGEGFPDGHIKPGSAICGSLDPAMCFSFSGLKTALLRRLQKMAAEGVAMPLSDAETARIAAEFQEAVVNALMKRAEKALDITGASHLAIGGGVSLNSRLREKAEEVCSRRKVTLLLAKPKYCGDNAAMIAGLAGTGQGVRGEEAISLDVTPVWTPGTPAR